MEFDRAFMLRTMTALEDYLTSDDLFKVIEDPNKRIPCLTVDGVLIQCYLDDRASDAFTVCISKNVEGEIVCVPWAVEAEGYGFLNQLKIFISRCETAQSIKVGPPIPARIF